MIISYICTGDIFLLCDEEKNDFTFNFLLLLVPQDETWGPFYEITSHSAVLGHTKEKLDEMKVRFAN